LTKYHCYPNPALPQKHFEFLQIKNASAADRSVSRQPAVTRSAAAAATTAAATVAAAAAAAGAAAAAAGAAV